MSRNLTKRAFSLLISLALILSLVSAIAFATGESEAAQKIVVDFTTATSSTGKTADLAGSNFTTDSEKSTTISKTYKPSVETTANGEEFLKACVYDVKKAWPDGTRAKWTINVKSDMFESGKYYSIKVNGASKSDGEAFYVYVDGQYAGVYDFQGGEALMPIGEKVLNTVQVDADADKTVEVMFALASLRNSHIFGYVYLSELVFEPVENEALEVSEVCFDNDFPSELAPAEEKNISAYVKMNDGSYRYFEKYDYEGESATNNSIKTGISWNQEKLSLTGNSGITDTDDGKVSAALTANTAGEADVKVTAIVDGKTYTYKKTVWVIDPENPPTEFTLKMADNFTKGTNSHSYVSTALELDNSWKWNGFSVNEEQTSDKAYATAVGVAATANKTEKSLVNIRLNVGEKTYEEANEMIVFTKNVPVEGWYKVNVAGVLGLRGGTFAIYANNQYIGTYNFNKSGDDTYEEGEALDMNAVYLPAGEVDISFRAVEIPYSDPAIYLDQITFTAWQPSDADAEDIENTISYIVRAEDSANNSKVTVSDTEYTVNGTNVGDWTVGESFTATATGSDFAYWANGSGAPVSTSASYTFNPTSNFTLEAVYAPADATTKKVQFWNYNKVFLDEVTATEETLGEKMPANPTLNGWNFIGWKTDVDTTFDATTVITDAITRVVAQFKKNAPAFSVGEEIKAYDDTYTDTAADEKDGTAFSYWTIDGQVASYNKTLSFNVWDTVNVVPVYAGTKTAVPTVVLDKVSNEEYFILYEVPEGYTAVDAGIVFGNNEPRVDSTDGSKASVKKAGAKGQFTAAPHEGAAATVKARGYVMYTDNATGALRILYTTAQ